MAHLDGVVMTHLITHGIHFVKHKVAPNMDRTLRGAAADAYGRLGGQIKRQKTVGRTLRPDKLRLGSPHVFVKPYMGVYNGLTYIETCYVENKWHKRPPRRNLRFYLAGIWPVSVRN